MLPWVAVALFSEIGKKKQVGHALQCKTIAMKSIKNNLLSLEGNESNLFFNIITERECKKQH